MEDRSLHRELAAARAQINKQDEQLEELQRQAHRQAAPFRRPENQRIPQPTRPGRKAGHAGCYRPKPDQVDEQIRVNLECCPHCQGPVSRKQSLTQYIEEIPVVRPRVTQPPSWNEPMSPPPTIWPNANCARRSSPAKSPAATKP
jgi:hypothetical protein